MDEMIVESKSALVAAIKAGSRLTFEAAKANPFVVRLGTTVYTFKAGLHERHAKEIVRNIHRTPARAFDEGKTLWTM
jgi:hypothetical protein